MGIVMRALGGCLAVACATSLSGAAALPAVERTLSAANITGVFGLGEIDHPEQRTPDYEIPVSVTEVEHDSRPFDPNSVAAAGRNLSGSALGIPAMVLQAYQSAADRIATDIPGCGLRWEVLAGIGKIESSHARGGQLNDAGVTVPRIIGPVLDGRPGVAAIRDTDGGMWDGDRVWDRAVGPMQFIPGTWRAYGADGDGDGIADPHNVWDSTLSAGRYLCAGGGNLSNNADLRAALSAGVSHTRLYGAISGKACSCILFPILWW
jgi:membrane-bound lytic murein transglycosylase B